MSQRPGLVPNEEGFCGGLSGLVPGRRGGDVFACIVTPGGLDFDSSFAA